MNEPPIPMPPRRTSMDTHSTRSNISKVRDRERDTQKARIGKASKESLVLLALEKEENRKLLSALEDYQKSNLELLNRAQQAEADLVAATSRIVQVHNNRVKLNEDVDRANALIQQYRVQLEAAQGETRKADQAIQRLEELRRKEKERADKYKEAFQKMNEAVALQRAREEGRIAGFREGLRQGQAEAEARYPSALNSRLSAIENDDRQSSNRSSSHHDSEFSDSQEGPIPPSTQAENPPVQARMSPPHIVDTTQYRAPSSPPPVIPPPPSPPMVSSPPLPIPAPTRNLNSNEPIRPIMTHQHPNFQSPPPPQEPIPPEGFIPRADPDTQHIPLPHRHELSRQHYMTQIPQTVSFPEPEPALSFPEPDPRIIPPPGSYRNATVNMMTEQQYRATQSSPESASTVMSLAQMELVNSNPNLRRTQSPMSTILEAPSGQATPNVVEEHVLPRKSSMRSVSSSGHHPHTSSKHVPSDWGRMSTDEDEEPARIMTPSNSSTRSMGRKSSVKSFGSSRRGLSGNDPPAPQIEPYAPYTYPTTSSSARGDPRRDTTTPPVAVRTPYTHPTPPPLTRRDSRSDSATPPVARVPYTYPTPPPNTRGDSRRDTTTPPVVNRTSYGRPTPPPPPQIYGIYAPPRTMGDIREEEERLTPTLPADRPLSPQQTGLRSPRPDVHVDLPHPPNTTSTLADDVPTPSSLSIGIDVVSPTPPESLYGEHEPNQTIREFLSPQDVQSRPLPPDTHTERSITQTVPPPPSMTASSPQIQALPDGGFFVPMTFTPKPATGDAPLPSSPGPGIFVPQKFTPTVPPHDLVSSPRPTSSRPSSPSGSNMPGGFTDLDTPAVEEPPVIPPANLLRAAQNISDSDDESGMNSEANTLTTPPSKAKGLPSQRGGGASTRGAAPTTRARGGGKKKKR